MSRVQAERERISLHPSPVPIKSLKESRFTGSLFSLGSEIPASCFENIWHFFSKTFKLFHRHYLTYRLNNRMRAIPFLSCLTDKRQSLREVKLFLERPIATVRIRTQILLILRALIMHLIKRVIRSMGFSYSLELFQL